MSAEEYFIESLREIAADKTPNAFNFQDDIALLAHGQNDQIICSKDMIVEGTHFFKTDPLDLIIKKAIRVNISDIIAKGGKLYGIMIGISINDANQEKLDIISNAIKQECRKLELPLMGGDFVKGSLTTISITIFGTCQHKISHRHNAKLNDSIYVTGTLGHSHAGLCILQNKLTTSQNQYYINHYHLPNPPVTLGIALAPFMNASCDVSDGLMIDLEHIIKASQVSAMIDIEHIPMTDAFDTPQDNLSAALYGGDDYQILFTSSAHSSIFDRLAQEHQTIITKIGTIIQGPPIIKPSQTIPSNINKFSHF